MTTDGTGPRLPDDEREPPRELLREVFDLVDETVARLTDDEIDARLCRLFRATGHSSQAEDAAIPASDEFHRAVLGLRPITGPAGWEAESLLAAARREAETCAADARRAAQDARGAREQAERIIAEARQCADAELGRAAKIVLEAREQAERIIADAEEKALQRASATHGQAGDDLSTRGEGARGTMREVPDGPAGAAGLTQRQHRALDPEEESRRRMQKLLDHGNSDRALDHLDFLVTRLISAADQLRPQEVTAQVLDQQRQVEDLLSTPLLPHQQFRLYMLAGHLAALMALSLLDVGELAKAGTCCLEAAVYTELTGHEGLRAWTLAVNGLIDAAARKAAGDRAGGEAAGLGRDATRTDGAPWAEVASRLPRAEQFAPAGGWPAIDIDSDERLIAPGGRATPPKLAAMVKERIARFPTAAGQCAQPPAGISHAFRPPV